jgi:hypothetical protein
MNVLLFAALTQELVDQFFPNRAHLLESRAMRSYTLPLPNMGTEILRRCFLPFEF